MTLFAACPAETITEPVIDTVAQAWNALDEANARVLITVEEGSDDIVSDACDG